MYRLNIFSIKLVLGSFKIKFDIKRYVNSSILVNVNVFDVPTVTYNPNSLNHSRIFNLDKF